MTTPAPETTLFAHGLTGKPLSGVTVIDNHCHLGPHCGSFQPHNDAAGLVRTMDRIGIRQSCIFSTMAILYDMRAGNTLTLKGAAQFPDRLLAYVVPNPHEADLVRDELQRCFDRGAVGIKFHASAHRYPFAGPGYVPAFEFAHEHRLPLISHGIESPETLRRIAHTYPRAHFIVAHAGGRSVGEQAELVSVVAAEPNIYLDTASSVGYRGDFAQMVQAAGAHKLLFGSDTPWTCASFQLGRVLLASIGEDEKRLVLGENMVRLLATRT